jgi:hypothetical protein
MGRFFNAAVRGLFYPAIVVAITLALTANHHAGNAAAATLRAGAASATKHREPIAHIAKGAKAAKKARAAKASEKRKSGKRLGHAASALPEEGIFGGCYAGSNPTICEQNLRIIHAAGFDIDVASVGGSLSDMAEVAAYAQSIGMSIMWEINDPGFWGGAWAGSSAPNDFPEFASACGCTGSTQILDYMIQDLSSLPGTYGYYAADDELLTPGETGGLTHYVNEIKAVDPNHMVMVGSNESEGTRYFSTGATIGNEIYPQTTGSLMPYAQNLGTWQAVEQSISQDQNAGDRAGTQTAYILQAFTFGDNLTDGEAVGVCTPRMTQAQCASKLSYPSAASQLELRNEVLEHADPKLILWYSFDESYAQGDRWAGLQQAINAPAPLTATATAARARQAEVKVKVARAKAARAKAARTARARRAKALTSR